MYNCKCIIAVLFYGVLLLWSPCTMAQQREGFFNGSSFVRLPTPLSLQNHTGLSFRTCDGGELFLQKVTGGNMVLLEVRADGLLFSVTVQNRRYEARLSARLLDNTWHSVNLLYRLGNLTLSAAGHQQVVANSTFNSEILSNTDLSSENAVLIVGNNFRGCILEGPSLVFNSSLVKSHNVEWGSCPLNTNSCTRLDHCFHEPCMRHGECVSRPDKYECHCAARYSGNNCEIDNGPPCNRNGGSPCTNGGQCEEDAFGNYVCNCDSSHTGIHCEAEVSSHLCESNPCHNNGVCRVTGGDRYECSCQPGFTGIDCGVNTNECQSSPCQHGGTCIDGINNYICHCGRTGYKGTNCEMNINECENNPCLNSGVCFDNYGSYTCQCTSGFGGQNCELNLNECSSNPCGSGNRCIDLVGSYECQCHGGYVGSNCEGDVNKCETAVCPPNTDCVDGVGSFQCVCKPGYPGVPPNCAEPNVCNGVTCLNGGLCQTMGDHYNCSCLAGFTGLHCEHPPLADWCSSAPCRNGGTCLEGVCQCPPLFAGPTCETHVKCAANPCQHASACQDYNGGYYCLCEPGWTGTNCDMEMNECLSDPCRNSGTCIDSINAFYCECVAGFTGKVCQVNIDECSSNPCMNEGVCLDHINGYTCNCTDDFMGENCERDYDACGLTPCQNNGTCINKQDKRDYYCECATGFEGLKCESNVNDCLRASCPEDKICVDGVNDYECRCKEGFSGENCTVDIDQCADSPCLNNATCIDGVSNHTCVCPSGYTGHNCEGDINECDISDSLCNYGICLNTIGSYQCFCRPGFSGDHCDLDFDECLSKPCYNDAMCENKINGFKCICTPGYTGKECSVNINECESDPCQSGATCVDMVAMFSCACPQGLTGKLCETNIDDCEMLPCQNQGTCLDGLDSYTCDCSDTGYEGLHCDINIDDCAGNPCENGARCIDRIKDYECECFAGYTGKNCTVDVNECESSPCQYGGTCLEHSNRTLYLPPRSRSSLQYATLPLTFFQEFNYSTASGYNCVCQPGITGRNCEINVNECESLPCQAGTCKDTVGGYECECDGGFEGTHCEMDINECDRYLPCEHGTCLDKHGAGYYCECPHPPKFGGKNCSVELVGCTDGACLNNGTCTPYLENEVFHMFNCSCPNGFHGKNCKEVTTMSLTGSSYILVNTTRDEGYDIQFRFKTTLPSGLLAIGKGHTFYILELDSGRLNLRSSLLNKWKGVFIGSQLNDSNWQKVFVAINSSHLVLAANEEQTIYPINLNEGSNASDTSFPTTYLGGTIPPLRKLTDGPPSFVGCTQDVVINGQWVLPQDLAVSPVVLVRVELGCPREAQCESNPCHNGGHCTDLWRDFSCSCERPYLGHKCQYNLTAATFGHENTTASLVTVWVNDGARRAVRSIVDISMFVRTRQDRGAIFYMGSVPNPNTDRDETLIAAQLEGGELLVRIMLNTTPEWYTVGGVKLVDGNNHLIQVVRNVTLVQVKINGTEYFRKTISATGQLDAQVLYLGGMPPAARYSRQVDPTSTTRIEGPINFKGIIQDVQISNGSRTMVVQFFPLGALDLEIPPPFGNVSFKTGNVLEGIVSDDSCRADPCLHDSNCTVTWNDFSCSCPLGYKGKMCQEMEFCQLQDCPSGSWCQNLDDGYECLANATFEGRNTSLGFSLSILDRQSLALDSIDITYRSRVGGTMLYLSSVMGTEYFSLSVFRDQVAVAWKLDETSPGQVHRFRKDEPDGNWTSVRMHMRDGGIQAGIDDASEESSQSFMAANFSLAAWQLLVETGRITLGAGPELEEERHNYITAENSLDDLPALATTTPAPSTVLIGGFFKGCLGEVRIGGLLLPYFTADQLNASNTTARDHFFLSGSPPPEVGCLLCFDHECLNEGRCEDAGESYVCECGPGFQADDCSINVDECVASRCENGATCIDGIANYTCSCTVGWTGWLCETEMDECESNPCMHNGTCVDRPGSFVCDCPDTYMGPQCQYLKLITCDNGPCRNGSTCSDVKNAESGDNFTCTCVSGYEGPYCNEPYCAGKTPCLNGGTCDTSRQKPYCACILGYEGLYCEINVDDCAESPCLNDGICVDLVANYSCQCNSTGYEGPNCQLDIDECIVPGMARCGKGRCINSAGSYTCRCPDGKCGEECLVVDPCKPNPCKHEGICKEECSVKPGKYTCECRGGFGGDNCTQPLVESSNSQALDIAIIVAPILGIILLVSLIGLSVFITMARKKRATRGTYSPSQQEYCNPRVEMDNVMKPPPEERLI